MNGSPKPVDVLIVGGGPAGLTAAVSVARNRHTAILFDSQEYRNARTPHFHMLPTWDGKHPKEFRDAARTNTLDNYATTQFKDVKIERVRKLDDGSFEATDTAGQSYHGKSLLLATGVVDVYPDIEGYAECWAYSIFHCLFCHGYEQRDSPSSGVLAIDDVAKVPFALHVSRNAAQLTKNVTIYTHGNTELAKALEQAIGDKAPVSVDARKIVRFVPGPNKTGLTVHFEDGETKEEAFVAHKPVARLRGDFADQLGLERMPDGDIKVSPPFGETSVSGCFAAGDNSTFLKTVPSAINNGSNASAGLASHVQAAMYGQMSLGQMITSMQAGRPVMK